jgi:hypothetical protein
MHLYQSEHRANTWDELKAVIAGIDKDHKALKEKRGGKTSQNFSTPLFRGHGDVAWHLQTTLERETSKKLSVSQYFGHYVKPAHKCLSGIHGDLWTFNNKAKYLVDNLRTPPLPNYAFLCYLRHHGFPSPLLDWSRSIYVAAFFAFQVKRDPKGEVAVYWYQRTLGHGHGYDGNKPCMVRLGRWTQGHKRHFLQQSEYTLSFEPFKDEAVLVPTEDVIRASAMRLQDQDRLYKITMPQTMRCEAMVELNKMNVNAYSVYQTDDGLVESVGWRLFNETD